MSAEAAWPTSVPATVRPTVRWDIREIGAIFNSLLLLLVSKRPDGKLLLLPIGDRLSLDYRLSGLAPNAKRILSPSCTPFNVAATARARNFAQ